VKAATLQLKVLAHCTGCGETMTVSPRLVGALCGKGRVRLATAGEALAYSKGAQ
jgi:hypothetical protein